MLIVQKQIQDAHNKLKQQAGGPTPTPSQMMGNASGGQGQLSSGASGQSQDPDQSRLLQWTKQSNTNTRAGPSSMFAPPGLSQKDWQTTGNNPNDSWETNQDNDSSNSNQADSHAHNNQGSSSNFADPLSDFTDEADGPPPFVPGQLWNWKSSLPHAEDDPHVTPTSSILGPRGPSSGMNNLNVGGAER